MRSEKDIIEIIKRIERLQISSFYQHSFTDAIMALNWMLGDDAFIRELEEAEAFLEARGDEEF